MREIKFRAWVAKKKVMTLGHSLAKWQGMNSVNNFDEIMEYTGLKDKNGVEIYEDDIVEIQWIEDEAWDIGQVQYYDAGFRFTMENEGYNHDPNHLKEKSISDLWDDPSVLVIEVIGNIYENKDLLK